MLPRVPRPQRWLLQIVLLCQVSLAQEYYKVSSYTIHDADTFTKATVELPWDVSLSNRIIRCSDYDAWEVTRTRKTVVITDEEIQKGKTAKEDLTQLLKNTELWISPEGRQFDVYGRMLGRLYYGKEKKSLMEYMKSRGHLRNADKTLNK